MEARGAGGGRRGAARGARGYLALGRGSAGAGVAGRVGRDGGGGGAGAGGGAAAAAGLGGLRAAAERGPRGFWEREGLGELREAAEAVERDRNVRRPGLSDVEGKWRLVWTTGEGGKKGDGMYFPVKAEQSFCSNTKKLRNGIYAGPLSFYFDGPLRYSDKRSILEFTFDTVSLALGPLGPLAFDAGGPEWDPAAEAPTAKGPFFRFLHADDACLVARGRSGGLALWQRVSSEPTVAVA